MAGRGNRTSSLLDLSALRRAKTGGIKAENRRGRGGREGSAAEGRRNRATFGSFHAAAAERRYADFITV